MQVAVDEFLPHRALCAAVDGAALLLIAQHYVDYSGIAFVDIAYAGIIGVLYPQHVFGVEIQNALQRLLPSVDLIDGRAVLDCDTLQYRIGTQTRQVELGKQVDASGRTLHLVFAGQYDEFVNLFNYPAAIYGYLVEIDGRFR